MIGDKKEEDLRMNRQRHYEDYQRARKKGQEGAKKKDAGSRSA